MCSPVIRWQDGIKVCVITGDDDYDCDNCPWEPDYDYDE